MAKIFISYRRDDSEFAARWVFESLTKHFGRSSVAFDVDTFPVGVDFRLLITKQVEECNVMLVMIGENWLRTTDDSGQRRLNNPDDFVRLEIETAFGRGIPVIPVLVGNSSIPHEAGLPDTLRKLAYQNATIVRAGKSLDDDLHQLIKGIERLLGAENVFGDRFLIEEPLDWGGIGQVYKACDLRAKEAGARNPYVALKVIDPESISLGSLESVQREARMAQRIAHPNILTVFDFGRRGDVVFAAMEYLEGTTLDRIIRANPNGLDTVSAERIIRDIATALAYGHTNDICHSDLKPENVFVTNEGDAKVFDFGMARLADKISETVPATSAAKHHSTQRRLSKEITSQGFELSRYAYDTFAFGCVVYEILTGRSPFPGQNPQDVAGRGKSADRIQALSNRKWDALNCALKPELSHYTVEQFHDQFFGKWPDSRSLVILGILVLVVIASVIAFVTLT